MAGEQFHDPPQGQEHGAKTLPNGTFSETEAERTSRIRIKNRRQIYLDHHPSYFLSPDLELADPLLYDRCIRRFLSPTEREADGRSKGYSKVLEADLYRSEAKLAALAGSGPSHETATAYLVSYVRRPDGQVLPEDADEIPSTKQEGIDRWKWAMTMRFLRGDDPDFLYQEVDEGEEWDMIETREAEERWFDAEEPESKGGASATGGRDSTGETGIQDF